MTTIQSTDAEPTTAEAVETRHPRTDVYAGETGCVLVCELPGVCEQDLTVELEGDQLHLRALTSWKAPEGLRLVHGEFEPVCYERRFRLGESLDPQSIQATLRNGLLRIRVERRTPTSRRIPVRSESGNSQPTRSPGNGPSVG